MIKKLKNIVIVPMSGILFLVGSNRQEVCCVPPKISVVPQLLPRPVRTARSATLFAVLFLLLSGCANFVVLSPAGSLVRLISAEEAENCEKIADTVVMVAAKVGVIRRDPEKVQVEAQNIAKNSAPDFDANAVTPLSELGEDGKQTFGIYQCPE